MSIKKIISDYYYFFKTNIPFLFKTFFLPILIGFLTSYIVEKQLSFSDNISSILIFIMYLLVMIIFSSSLVSLHRKILLGDKERLAWFRMPKFIDLKYFLLWWLYYFLTRLGKTFGDTMNELELYNGPARIFGILLTIFCIFLITRLCLIFPIISLNKESPFKSSYKLTENKFWIISLLLFLSVLFGLLMSSPTLILGFTGITQYIGGLWTVIIILQTVTISLCITYSLIYKELTTN